MKLIINTFEEFFLDLGVEEFYDLSNYQNQILPIEIENKVLARFKELNLMDSLIIAFRSSVLIEGDSEYRTSNIDDLEIDGKKMVMMIPLEPYIEYLSKLKNGESGDEYLDILLLPNDELSNEDRHKLLTLDFMDKISNSFSLYEKALADKNFTYIDSLKHLCQSNFRTIPTVVTDLICQEGLFVFDEEREHKDFVRVKSMELVDDGNIKPTKDILLELDNIIW